MTERALDTARPAPGLASELLANIALLLEVLQRVGAGEDVPTLELRYAETHPVGALTASLNEMISSLSQARLRSEGYSQELREKLHAIEAQDAAIAELTTPILEVWKGVLCMPIVGIMDSARAADMARTLLGTIVRTKSSLVILDITGIQVMDTRAVDHFLRTARAVRLLGARCVLSGVHPNVSQTIVHMGLDLTGVETHRSLRDALRALVAPQQSKRGPRREQGEAAANAGNAAAAPAASESAARARAGAPELRTKS
jgi:rsbT co-antagonist protein RsbR